MSILTSQYDKFLYTADNHIKKRTWTNSALLQEDAIWALTTLGDSVENKTDTIVIGGDLFDTNRPTSKDVIDTIFYLRYKFKFIHYIRGNHDSVDPSFIGAINDNDAEICLEIHEPDAAYLQPDAGDLDLGVSYRTTQEAYILGIPYINNTKDLVGYISYYVAQWRKLKIDKPLYLLLHTSFKHLLGFDGAYQLTVDDIKNLCGNDPIYVLTGHIHTRDTTVYNERGAYIHSPGSTYPLSSDAMGIHCYGSLITYATGEIENIPCDVRKYVELSVEDIKDPLHLETELLRAGYKPDKDCLPTYVRIILPEDYGGQITGINNENFVTHLVSKTAVKAAQAIQSKAYTFNEAIAEELLGVDNSEMLLDMANALLLSDDQVQLLDDWLKAWQVRKAT